MGTHPIFESDFDCLTDLSYGPSNLYHGFRKIRFNRWCCFLRSSPKTNGCCQRYLLNRLLCDDGNCGRYEVNVKNIRLTDSKIKISWGARPGTVKKAWAAANMTDAYAATDLAKAAATKARRANLTDFERYKLMRLKQARNRIVNQEVGKLRKQK